MNDDVREADKPVRECLLPTPFSFPSPPLYEPEESEEDQLRRALEESEREFELQNTIILSRSFQEESERRAKQIAPFKFRFKQFMRIDIRNKEFYADIIRYIEKYELCELNSVHIGEEYYSRFRRTLDNMRMTQEEKTRLLEIFIE